MEATLLFLAAGLMFSGVHSVSQSMSCSTVNGKTICDKQTSDGNSAMSSSSAGFGEGTSFQQTYAGAGGPFQWDSSSQTVNGGYPGGFYNPPISYDYYGTQDYPGSFGGGSYSGVSSYVSSGSPNFYHGSQAGGFAMAGGGPLTGVSSYVSSSSPNFFRGSQAGGGAIAGGGPFTGVSSYVSSGSPNFFGGSQAGGGAFAGGFAAAGNVPFNYPAVGYPDQDYSSPNGGSSGPMPGGVNPMDFVNKFMGGFFGRR